MTIEEIAEEIASNLNAQATEYVYQSDIEAILKKHWPSSDEGAIEVLIAAGWRKGPVLSDEEIAELRNYIAWRKRNCGISIPDPYEMTRRWIATIDQQARELSAAEEQIRQLRESGKAIFGVCESLTEGMRLIAEATGLGDIPELDDTVIERVKEVVAENARAESDKNWLRAQRDTAEEKLAGAVGENVALRDGLAAAHQYVKGGCVCTTGRPHNHPVCANISALLNTEAKP